jgi:hypothetical protein
MKYMSAVVVALFVAAGFALPVAPAQADTPGCVTRKEYRKVGQGWTKARVDRRFDTDGNRVAIASSGGFKTSVWSYRACSRFSAVAISYDKDGTRPWKVVAKSAVWVAG